MIASSSSSRIPYLWSLLDSGLMPYPMAVRAASLQSVIDNYEMRCSRNSGNITSNSENRARITGVKAQMERFDFLFARRMYHAPH